MGHLISRAIRRFTQCSQSARSDQQRGQQQGGGGAAAAAGDSSEQAAGNSSSQQKQRDEGPTQQTVQSIPVGQSIDSAEYAGLGSNKENDTSNKDINYDNREYFDTLNGAVRQSEDGSNNKPQVEEAVIKIQALVRGHLTRKALKDAQHQGNTPPHALGQSQFDEESLTRNPSKLLSSKVPLESIAEDTETAQSASQSQPANERLARDAAHRLRLSPFANRSGQVDSRDSVSPVPSEANASIDLGCDTPASVSIDIADHNIKPTDRIASVLHHQTGSIPSPQINVERSEIPPAGPPRVRDGAGAGAGATTTSQIETPPPPTSPTELNHSPNTLDTPDSAEAAAIRIQSAFRGYKTRKHSPYRRRSPSDQGGTSPSAAAVAPASSHESNGIASKRVPLRQQDATVVDDLEEDNRVDQQPQPSTEAGKDEDEGIGADEIGRVAQIQDAGRRSSRQRQRDHEGVPDGIGSTSGDVLGAQSIEDFTTTTTTTTTTEDSTVKEMKPSQVQQQPLSANETDSNASMSNYPETTVGGALVASTRDEGNLMSAGQCVVDQSVAARQSIENTLDDVDLSAALETNSVSDGHPHKTPPEATLLANQRPSLGGKSDGAYSIEVDTDSSYLGAALSLNEEVSDTNMLIQSSTLDDGANLTEQHAPEPFASANKQVPDVDPKPKAAAEEEEEEMVSPQLEMPLGNLVEDNQQPATANQSGSSSGEMVGQDPHELARLSIELESDDIERRDPRGQASEERAKSPQIQAEQPSFKAPSDVASPVEVGGSSSVVSPPVASLLEEPVPGEVTISGRSSPALNSSNGATSSDDDGACSDQEKPTDGSPNQANQSAQKQGVGGGGGKRKRNRNKKKGKK